METEIEHLKRCIEAMREINAFVLSEANKVLKNIYTQLKKEKYKEHYKEIKNMMGVQVRDFDRKLDKIRKKHGFNQ